MQARELSARERTRFDVLARTRSWDWLAALCGKLRVELQLVDDEGAPVLEHNVGTSAPHLSELLASGAAPLRQAIGSAVRNRATQAVSIDDVQVVCLAVAVDHTVGALVLSRMATSGIQSAEQIRGELEIIGQWLVSAIEAHLQEAPQPASDALDRLSTLAETLTNAFDDRPVGHADRRLISQFADILAIWYDVELYGYVDAPSGDFVPEVMLPGSEPAMPPVISATALPEIEFPRFSEAESLRVGFHDHDRVLVTTLSPSAGSWLLVVRGATETVDLRQLEAYVTLLDGAVLRASANASAHAAAEISKHLLMDGEGRLADAVMPALQALNAVVAAQSLEITIDDHGGHRLLHAASGEASSGDPVTETRRVADHSLFLSMTPIQGHVATPSQRAVLRVAADLFEGWAHHATGRGRADDRRHRRGALEQLIDRFASQAMERGVPVTAIVLSISEDDDAARQWVRELRSQLRAADVVGLLGDREIGLLLDDTSAEEARTIVSRLRAPQGEDRRSPWTAIGVASRAPGAAESRPLVHEAREQAYRNAS